METKEDFCELIGCRFCKEQTNHPGRVKKFKEYEEDSFKCRMDGFPCFYFYKDLTIREGVTNCPPIKILAAAVKAGILK